MENWRSNWLLMHSKWLQYKTGVGGHTRVWECRVLHQAVAWVRWNAVCGCFIELPRCWRLCLCRRWRGGCCGRWWWLLCSIYLASRGTTFLLLWALLLLVVSLSFQMHKSICWRSFVVALLASCSSGLNVLGNVHTGQLEINASLGSSATGVLLLFFPIYTSHLLAFCCCCSSCKLLYFLSLRWVTKRGIRYFIRTGVSKHNALVRKAVLVCLELSGENAFYSVAQGSEQLKASEKDSLLWLAAWHGGYDHCKPFPYISIGCHI